MPARKRRSPLPTAACRSFRSPPSAGRSRCLRIATSPTAARSRFRSRCCPPIRCTRAPIRCSYSRAVRARPRASSGRLPRHLPEFARIATSSSSTSAARDARPRSSARRSSPTTASMPRSISIPCPRQPTARASSPRKASTPRNTRRRRGWPISMRCARRSATTRSISGAARTGRAPRRNICAVTPSTCGASCSTASRRRR